MNKCLVDPVLGQATSLELQSQTTSHWNRACWNKTKETIFLTYFFPVKTETDETSSWFTTVTNSSVPSETFLDVKRFTLRNYVLPYCGFGCLNKRRRFLTLEPYFSGSEALMFTKQPNLWKPGITMNRIRELYNWKTFCRVRWKRIFLRKIYQTTNKDGFREKTATQWDWRHMKRLLVNRHIRVTTPLHPGSLWLSPYRK